MIDIFTPVLNSLVEPFDFMMFPSITALSDRFHRLVLICSWANVL